MCFWQGVSDLPPPKKNLWNPMTLRVQYASLNECPPKKEVYQKDKSSSSHWLSGGMLVFMGVSGVRLPPLIPLTTRIVPFWVGDPITNLCLPLGRGHTRSIRSQQTIYCIWWWCVHVTSSWWVFLSYCFLTNASQIFMYRASIILLEYSIW